MQNNNSNGQINGQSVNTPIAVKSNSNDDLGRTYASQPQLTPLRETHRERSASGTMYRPDALYQVRLRQQLSLSLCLLNLLNSRVSLQGSLHNIPEYTSSRNDLSHSRAGSGVIKRYGSLRQSHPLGQSQVRPNTHSMYAYIGSCDSTLFMREAGTRDTPPAAAPRRAPAAGRAGSAPPKTESS